MIPPQTTQPLLNPAKQADDDTYVIVENLRHMLTNKNASDAEYYGRKFKPYVTQVRGQISISRLKSKPYLTHGRDHNVGGMLFLTPILNPLSKPHHRAT